MHVGDFLLEGDGGYINVSSWFRCTFGGRKLMYIFDSGLGAVLLLREWMNTSHVSETVD
jgi:hypothetical protein